jgi:hypothetical protein
MWSMAGRGSVRDFCSDGRREYALPFESISPFTILFQYGEH